MNNQTSGQMKSRCYCYRPFTAQECYYLSSMKMNSVKTPPEEGGGKGGEETPYGNDDESHLLVTI